MAPDSRSRVEPESGTPATSATVLLLVLSWTTVDENPLRNVADIRLKFIVGVIVPNVASGIVLDSLISRR